MRTSSRKNERILPRSTWVSPRPPLKSPANSARSTSRDRRSSATSARGRSMPGSARNCVVSLLGTVASGRSKWFQPSGNSGT
jgi:hypothetical protein